VHVIDFTDVTGAGADYQVLVGDQRSHRFRIAQDLYDQLAGEALGLFYLLRSGCPIDEQRAPGYSRPAGHTGVPPNRGDTAVPAWTGPEAARLYPGWATTNRLDVSGGWYDAGDYSKYTVSGSIAVWQMLNILALLRRATGQRAVLSEETLIEECRWQLDWLLRMQVPPGQPLAGMACHRVHGTEWSPMPGLPHEDPTFRVLHRPSTAATLQLAAVAAQAARLLRSTDIAYADRLLTAARIAHHAAQLHPDLIAPDDEGRFGGVPTAIRSLTTTSIGLPQNCGSPRARTASVLRCSALLSTPPTSLTSTALTSTGCLDRPGSTSRSLVSDYLIMNRSSTA
jgi:endoglucanase